MGEEHIQASEVKIKELEAEISQLQFEPAELGVKSIYASLLSGVTRVFPNPKGFENERGLVYRTSVSTDATEVFDIGTPMEGVSRSTSRKSSRSSVEEPGFSVAFN